MINDLPSVSFNDGIGRRARSQISCKYSSFIIDRLGIYYKRYKKIRSTNCRGGLNKISCLPMGNERTQSMNGSAAGAASGSKSNEWTSPSARLFNWCNFLNVLTSLLLNLLM